MRPPGLPDDYLPVEHLASGGQADVWRVSRRSDRSEWVAKLYHSADPALLGEAVALSRLSHPAFPRVHGVSLTAGETHCLLIEHIPGETLDAWAAQHRGSATFATKATHVLTHLAVALAALHELDIAHRDLTPANVLLLAAFDDEPKRAGGLKLIDLGIATAVHEQTRAGTRPFRAPESFVRGAASGDGARADVFAWGVLAVWLFSGRFPTGLPGDASEEELRARYEDPLELSDGLSFVPARLRVVVRRALRVSPSDRPSNGQRVADALRASEMPATEEEHAGAVDDTRPRVEALSAVVNSSGAESRPPTPPRWRLQPDLLAHLHILLNYEWDASALLSLVLIGLPELEAQLSRRTNRSLLTRIHHRFLIESASIDDTAEYVRYRLGAVGAAHTLFPDDAIAELHACSQGSLREIDRIATMSLRDAARRKKKLVDKALVARAGQILVREE